jgi:ribosome-binding protein aMBF1 (putative translation factor)
MASEPVTMDVRGESFVIVPRLQYLELLEKAHGGQPLPDAKRLLRETTSRGLRLAREHAGLSQSALAKRLKVTQAMVSRTESGATRVAGSYVARVLKACKLPPDWVPSEI